jgi:hypothetical protein
LPGVKDDSLGPISVHFSIATGLRSTMGAVVGRSRLCRCSAPDRQRDADGVTFCGTCGELLPDDRDELLAFLVVKVDKLGREVEHLAETPTIGGGRAA